MFSFGSSKDKILSELINISFTSVRSDIHGVNWLPLISSITTWAVASLVTSYESYFETDVSSQIFSGTQTGSGFLNDNLQRLQDNLYYQNFSYSLKVHTDTNPTVSKYISSISFPPTLTSKLA